MIVESSPEFLVTCNEFTIECRVCGEYAKGITRRDMGAFKEQHEHNNPSEKYYVQHSADGAAVAAVKMSYEQTAVVEKFQRDAERKVAWRLENYDKFPTHEAFVEAFRKEFPHA
ncbi:hypothetical protein PAPYRUS_87 [Mycobacterium phage Papyrus]|uniref:Uncharacterized protein n=1 Tax=Mycobacterium phage Papyrus TaxID=1383056 RepID=S5Y827_9CAUD|nr:hypothetical protein N842_gp087 [Mycobacterium phage Papyrus]AGT14097.1 hypothetical protein PAPYRUS_87 [Mycobacterium phage Papyrus]